MDRRRESPSTRRGDGIDVLLLRYSWHLQGRHTVWRPGVANLFPLTDLDHLPGQSSAGITDWITFSFCA
jgi:hypothetical protein